MATATGNQLWSTGVVLGNESKVTFVRIRGQAAFFITIASNAGDGFQGAIGLGIITTEAFNAGTAGSPGAFTDADWDGWMYHTFFHIHSVTATEADGVNAVGAYLRVDIDTKAMRIFEDSETLFGSLEVVEDGASGMEFWAATRVLSKLS